MALDLCKGAVNGKAVTVCFEVAFSHPGNGGLGLHRGGAVELCKGAADAVKVLSCFEKAWRHPGNGGLGMSRGDAIQFCNDRPTDRVIP
jgi:hypothetical protein